MTKNSIIIAFLIFIVIDGILDGYRKWEAKSEYRELEQGCKDLMQLVLDDHAYADSMVTYGIVKSPRLLNKLKAGGTYEITPDSSKRRYWLLVEPDTTEFSNLK